MQALEVNSRISMRTRGTGRASSPASPVPSDFATSDLSRNGTAGIIKAPVKIQPMNYCDLRWWGFSTVVMIWIRIGKRGERGKFEWVWNMQHNLSAREERNFLVRTTKRYSNLESFKHLLRSLLSGIHRFQGKIQPCFPNCTLQNSLILIQ